MRNVIVFCVLAVCGLAQEDDECILPNKNVGYCTELEDCKKIASVVNNALPHMKDRISYYLELFRCKPGPEPVHSQTKMCCPDYKPPSTSSPPMTELEPPQYFSNNVVEIMKSPKQHRHWHLINHGHCGQNGGQHITPTILNRFVANKFVWMALLIQQKRNYETRMNCVGSIINSKYVLTSARCLQDFEDDFKLSYVRVGDFDISKNHDCFQNSTDCLPRPQEIAIHSTIMHNRFDPAALSSINDIGLIRLQRKINFIRSTNTICLPSFEEGLLVHGVVNGWSLHHQHGGAPKQSDIQLLSTQECAKIFAYQSMEFHLEQICGICENPGIKYSGDTGTPLIFRYDHKYIQFGVGAMNRPNSDDGLPIVFTYVPFHMFWILDNIYP